MGAAVQGENGRRLAISALTQRSIDDLAYTARLMIETGECAVGVWEYGTGLPQFFRALADDWAGFVGERRYDTIDGDLSLRCRHDFLGAVTCRVTIGRSGDPA